LAHKWPFSGSVHENVVLVVLVVAVVVVDEVVVSDESMHVLPLIHEQPSILLQLS
jgi:hypothetical protein